MKGSLVSPTPPAVPCSPGARDLISRILVPDPTQRLSLQVRLNPGLCEYNLFSPG